ncbi:unnamed protein product [Trichogramma brassicae]|uniref:Uncharacterized protein n=1 Tax=Trichogramma brassicae TaxID=86971 RepID=A0A6H5J1N4_9HYME|nr:unnamed protein product [Trichogramma brassicae]
MAMVIKLFNIYKNFNVNYTDEAGLTHFHAACMARCKHVIEKFLELGQDPNVRVGDIGDSPRFDHGSFEQLVRRVVAAKWRRSEFGKCKRTDAFALPQHPRRRRRLAERVVRAQPRQVSAAAGRYAIDLLLMEKERRSEFGSREGIYFCFVSDRKSIEVDGELVDEFDDQNNLAPARKLRFNESSGKLDPNLANANGTTLLHVYSRNDCYQQLVDLLPQQLLDIINAPKTSWVTHHLPLGPERRI